MLQDVMVVLRIEPIHCAKLLVNENFGCTTLRDGKKVFGHRLVVGWGHRVRSGSGTKGTRRRTQKMPKEVVEVRRERPCAGLVKVRKEERPDKMLELAKETHLRPPH